MARHSTPLFTRRHYEWLAAFAERDLPMAERMILTSALARECSNFNRSRFERACGITAWRDNLYHTDPEAHRAMSAHNL
jgi:hypothetical protein